jgi:hypothetical protein
MQLCHRLLIRALNSTNDVELLMSFVMLNSQTFSQACLARAIRISIVSETKDSIVAIASKSDELKFHPAVESLFLWNTSLSYRRLLSSLSETFSPYFRTHFSAFTPHMKLIASACQPNAFDAAEGFAAPEPLIAVGNQEYLMYLITFLTRLQQADVQVRTAITLQYIRPLFRHLTVLYDLLISASKLFDPAVDHLLCVALRVFVSFIGDFLSDSIAEPIFRFLFAAVRFLLGVPVAKFPAAITVEVGACFQTLVRVLRANGRFPAIAAARATSPNSPTMALILAELPARPDLVITMLLTLLLSEDPTVFSCALHLVAGHPGSNYDDLLFHFILTGTSFAPLAWTRLLVRLCLLMAVACRSDDFCAAFTKGPNFPHFCTTFVEKVLQLSIVAPCQPLQEAILFFLGSLYRSYHPVPKPIPIDPLLANDPEMCERVEELMRKDEDEGAGLPWRRQFVFQHLVESEYWAVSIRVVAPAR